MTYIRPVLDLWVFLPDLHKELEKVELKIIRTLFNIHPNSKKTEIYKNLVYENPSTRAIRLYSNMYSKGIIPQREVEKVLISGKTITSDVHYRNTKEHLSALYLAYKHLIVNEKDEPAFDAKNFKSWRLRAKTSIKNYVNISFSF